MTKQISLSQELQIPNSTLFEFDTYWNPNIVFSTIYFNNSWNLSIIKYNFIVGILYQPIFKVTKHFCIISIVQANSEEFFGIWQGNRKIVKVFYDFEDQ